MRTTTSALLAAAGAALLTGCANSEQILRPTLSINYIADQQMIDGTLNDGAVAFKCIRRTQAETGQNGVGPLDSAADPDGCLYEYVEITNLGKLLLWDGSGDPGKVKKKAFVALTISVTRQNCQTFLHRMFAMREGFTFWQRVIGDFAAVGSSASAFANPVASAAISGANLTSDHFMDAATQTYYQNAQSAFETAITSAMSADERTITKRVNDSDNDSNSSNQYPIMTAIADLDAYGRTCSVEGGLNQLNNAVQANKNSASGVLPVSSGTSPPPNSSNE